MLVQVTRDQFKKFVRENEGTGTIEGIPVETDSSLWAAMQYINDDGKVVAQARYYKNTEPRYEVDSNNLKGSQCHSHK